LAFLAFLTNYGFPTFLAFLAFLTYYGFPGFLSFLSLCTYFLALQLLSSLLPS
jgi:hypothetical protein